MNTKQPIKDRTFKSHIIYSGNNNIASLKWPTYNLFFNLQKFSDFHSTNDVELSSVKLNEAVMTYTILKSVKEFLETKMADKPKTNLKK